MAVGQDGRVTIFSGRWTGYRDAHSAGADRRRRVVCAIRQRNDGPGRHGAGAHEGYTAGSKTIQIGGVNVRKAAAEADRRCWIWPACTSACPKPV